MHTPSSNKAMLFNFDNSYARLPETFYAYCLPTPVSYPMLRAWNERLAAEFSLPSTSGNEDTFAALFSGNEMPTGATPMALAYAGHQFGHFVPTLGDGRALLLGEITTQEGKRYDIQLKGSGKTPFSRRGDGRAALGPVIREYILSEAMYRLGIPTTRSLAIVTTGEFVFRETPLPGAVLTRVAASHIRIGTFQYFAARGDTEAVRILTDYAIDRHYPHVRRSSTPYEALLRAVIDAQAMLIAKWMAVGFMHGVMNTDNMAISGETIDYGPCAFLDEYDAFKVFSSIDHHGRYAYGNQPLIANWNLARFAECLLPLLATHEKDARTIAEAALATFSVQFEQHWLAQMRCKLGLERDENEDATLIQTLLQNLQEAQADYTVFFRMLATMAEESGNLSVLTRYIPHATSGLQSWYELWKRRLLRESLSPQEIANAMRKVNPVYIPRNHQVAHTIAAAVERDDFSPMHKLLRVLECPYEDQPGCESYALPPLASERVTETFCGT